MNKIVIIPTFASSHLLEYWIENIISTINPDNIIINEGLMINGPENKTEIDINFRERWCYPNSIVGFDWEETLSICKKYADLVTLNCLIYRNHDANQSFIEAVSSFHGVDPRQKTLIFPLEPDAFLYDLDKDTINEEISKLQPGSGISVKWVDFLETQFYTEAINIQNPKYRRFCYCFDNMQNYKEAINGFMSQSYPKLKKVDSFFIRHYCWMQPDPWKQLRYELIYRSDPNYWAAFDKGLEQIRLASRIYSRHDEIRRAEPDTLVDTRISDKIVIRPSRSDEGRYAKFIDIEHPNAIKSHPNYVK